MIIILVVLILAGVTFGAIAIRRRQAGGAGRAGEPDGPDDGGGEGPDDAPGGPPGPADG